MGAMIEETLAYILANRQEPPALQEIVISPGFTGVLLDDGHAGLAMNVRRGSQFSDPAIEGQLAAMIGQAGPEACELLWDQPGMLHRSILVALLNALSWPFLETDYLAAHGYTAEADPHEYLKGLVHPEEAVVMVGFGGLVRSIANEAREVIVTELEPDLFRSTVIDRAGVSKGPKRVQIIPAAEARPHFARADVVFVTGSAMVTDTLESLLEECRHARVVVYGWSAAMFPAPFFARGVDVVATSRVMNSPAAMDILRNWGVTIERFLPHACQNLTITRKAE